MTLRHPYQGDPAKAFVRIQNIHDTGEDHVFEGVCPVSERESGGLKIEQIQVPLYMNQDYFSKEYPFMRMLNASLLIQPNKLEFSSSSMLTFLRVSGIDDDGDKIPQNGDDNASLGFHIAKEYTFEQERTLDDGRRVVRFCTSWATTEAEKNQLIGDIRKL